LRCAHAGVSLYDSTFSRNVWRLYGGAKGLVMWYYAAAAQQNSRTRLAQNSAEQCPSRVGAVAHYSDMFF
jgi:hypothetical protein